MKGAKRLAILGAAIALMMGHGPAQAQGKPHYVIGKPYQFDGVWYEPAVDYGYDQTGIAVDLSGRSLWHRHHQRRAL